MNEFTKILDWCGEHSLDQTPYFIKHGFDPSTGYSRYTEEKGSKETLEGVEGRLHFVEEFRKKNLHQPIFVDWANRRFRRGQYYGNIGHWAPKITSYNWSDWEPFPETPYVKPTQEESGWWGSDGYRDR